MKEYAIEIKKKSDKKGNIRYNIHKVPKPEKLGEWHIYSPEISKALSKVGKKRLGLVRITERDEEVAQLTNLQPISPWAYWFPGIDIGLFGPHPELKGKDIPLMITEKVLTDYYENHLGKRNEFYMVTDNPHARDFFRNKLELDAPEEVQLSKAYGPAWIYRLSGKDVHQLIKTARKKLEE